MPRRKRPKEMKAERPRVTLGRIARECGCALGSIGDLERLAGINTQCEADRTALWNRFRHLFTGPTQQLFDAVMDDCATVVLGKLERGELCLTRTHWPA